MKQFYLSVLFLFVLLATVPAAGQTVEVPDPNFLSFLKDHYSTVVNSSDQLIIAQAKTITGIFDCSNQDIKNLEGIQHFTGITTLDADDNLLTDISQIANLTALHTIRVENNYLTSLPDLSGLPNLRILIAYDNKLVSLPDLSANTELRELVVINNSLSSLPDFSALANLTKVELNNNFLSFEDLLPLKDHPDFTSFVITAQKKFPVDNREVVETDSLILITGYDQNVTDVTYTWNFNSQTLASVMIDSLVLYPVDHSHHGKYFAVLTHPSFPGLQIITETLTVDVISCPGPEDFSFEYGKVNCIETGSLKINLTSLPTQVYTFYLSSPVTGDTLISTTGFFNGLNQPEYVLSIKSGPVCRLTLPDRIAIPFEECKEAFITPDGDGDKDSHYFSVSGTAVIYDKSGNAVQVLSLPGEWDGSSENGQLVSPGYYSADINRGEKYVNISVLY